MYYFFWTSAVIHISWLLRVWHWRGLILLDTRTRRETKSEKPFQQQTKSHWHYFSTKEYVSPVELLSLPMQMSLEHRTAGNKDAFACVWRCLRPGRERKSPLSYQRVDFDSLSHCLWLSSFTLILLCMTAITHLQCQFLLFSSNPWFFQSALFASALYRWEVKEQLVWRSAITLTLLSRIPIQNKRKSYLE